MATDLMGINFNALRALQTVFRLGSISAAADALDLQQPSVSYTIDRLRRALDDPLFLRQGRGIAPTERCLELMPVVDRILKEADHLGTHDFDPATSTVSFRLVVSGFLSAVLIPSVLRRLGEEAPNLRLNISMLQGSAAEKILQGSADIVLSIESLNVTGVYSERNFLSDTGVCVLDANHPLANKQLTLDDLRKARFIFTHPVPNYRAPFVIAAAEAGIDIQPVVEVSDISITPLLIRGTDMLGGIPSRMAAQYAPELATARWPFDLKPKWSMYWAATANRSRPNMWMRNLILEEAGKLGPPVEL
jgi:DNA-binding transcriptional LysR family regulator